MLHHPARKPSLALLCALVLGATTESSWAFAPIQNRLQSSSSSTSLNAAPRRLEDNVDGPLYVNEKCINCAACALFAPDVFHRSSTDRYHTVHHQPESPDEIETARAALAACPVAAIRVETDAHRHHRNMQALTPSEKELAAKLAINPKFNGLELPFPRPISSNAPNVYFVGHHNEKSFGAVPYLVHSKNHGWIMVDTPRFNKAAIDAVTSITGPQGPAYLMLTHVDDTEGHDKWKEEFPELKRIFHTGDLGRHNWRGDLELEHCEVLLDGTSDENKLKFFTIDGQPTETTSDDDVYIVHTPGHSPGSIVLWKKPASEDDTPGIIFTGDSYAYTTRDNGRMTGFARYGNNRVLQSKILPQLAKLDWQVVAAGHGHPREYTTEEKAVGLREMEMEAALNELSSWGSRVRM